MFVSGGLHGANDADQPTFLYQGEALQIRVRYVITYPYTQMTAVLAK